jgi:hypothetical protein
MPKKDYRNIQAEFREKAKPKFHPKGTKVIYKEPAGSEREIVNAAPLKPSGKAYQDRTKSKKGATHTVKPSGQGKKPCPKAFFPAAMTNHDKMIWRADQRKAKLAK